MYFIFYILEYTIQNTKFCIPQCIIARTKPKFNLFDEHARQWVFQH